LILTEYPIRARLRTLSTEAKRIAVERQLHGVERIVSGGPLISPGKEPLALGVTEEASVVTESP
jgi:hypothetical protein